MCLCRMYTIHAGKVLSSGLFLRRSGGKVARASWAGAVGKTLQGSKIVKLRRG